VLKVARSACQTKPPFPKIRPKKGETGKRAALCEKRENQRKKKVVKKAFSLKKASRALGPLKETWRDHYPTRRKNRDESSPGARWWRLAGSNDVKKKTFGERKKEKV